MCVGCEGGIFGLTKLMWDAHQLSYNVKRSYTRGVGHGAQEALGFVILEFTLLIFA